MRTLGVKKMTARPWRKTRIKDEESVAVVYVRVSTEEQLKGFSMEVQERDCCEYVRRNGWSLDRVFREEGETAKNMDRPALIELKDYLSENKDEVDFLVVHKVDRLSRKADDGIPFVCDLKDMGISTTAAAENFDETPMGRFIRTMLFGQAELDNDIRAERTWAGMEYAFQQGNWLWRPPVGYKVVKTPEGEKNRIEKSTDARHIAKAFDLMKSGLHSQADVTRILGRDGMKISSSSLARILRNPFYAGIMVSSLSEKPVDCKNYESIISVEDFETTQRVLDGRKPKVVSRCRSNPTFPLVGLLACPACGMKLTGSLSTGRNGEKYGYYHCQKSGCQRARKEGLEKEFVRTLQGLEPKDGVAELFLEVVRDIWKQKQKAGADREKNLRRELKDLAAKQQKIADMAIDGVFDKEKFREQDAIVAREIDAKNREFARILKEPDRVLDCTEYCCSLFKNLSKLWEKGDITVKKQVQGIVFPLGVKWQDGVLRNTHISPILRLLGQENADEVYLVPPTGFEPVPPP